MILRIFATDGFTPEQIFRWSVEETAEHLCEQQVLWVTRLDGPWQRLVNWFLKQPCCRAVVLDHADAWDWYDEHEVTFRIAQGLCYKREPQAVCWIHDDMAPPSGQKAKEHVERWLSSASTALEAQAYQMWDDFNYVRVDPGGIGIAGDWHFWLAKWSPDLRWTAREGDTVPAINRDRFQPVNAADSWKSPWPFRHAKGVDKDFREGNGFVRKGFQKRLPSVGVRSLPYDPNLTWDEFKTLTAAR